MRWAPVQHVAPQICKERGELRVCDLSRVEWHKNGRLYKIFSMKTPVKWAGFAYFKRHPIPDELWVCIVLADQSVHSFATLTGESKITGLNFQPEKILVCGKLGLVFVSQTEVGLDIWLLQRPEELLQAILPSATARLLSSNEQLMFMDENVAVMWDETNTTIRVLCVKVLTHSSRLNNVWEYASTGFHGNDLKAAILSPLIEWKQVKVGRIFTQELSASRVWLLASHDPETKTLFIYLDGSLMCYEQINLVAPLAGIMGIPLISCLKMNQLQIMCLFSSKIDSLGIPVSVSDPKINDVTNLSSEVDQNWLQINFASGTTQRLNLYTHLGPELEQCFELIGYNTGISDLAVWMMDWLDQRRSTNDDWQAFCETFVRCINTLSEQNAVQTIFHLHMLREEFGLFETKEGACEQLASILWPYVKSWGEEWRQIYADGAGESTESPKLIQRGDLKPLSVLKSLINQLDPAYGQSIPDLTQMKSFFPTTWSLHRIFGLIKGADIDQNISEIRNELECSKISGLLPNLKYCLQACFLQILRLVKISTVPQTIKKPSRQNMFPENRISDEALNMLQIKNPQHVIYGTFIDRLSSVTDESVDTHGDWSIAIKQRTLASAFGRAALNLETLDPLMWEQLSIPLINFSGECSETGLTISATQDGLDDGDTRNAWGVFSHGTALALSISRKSKVDNMWVTSLTRLKTESKIFYAGFVYGLGLIGLLKNLEDWQFYESLVGSDQYGALAALIGVAASKIGTRDSKLTKVLSVHIRALLPHGFSGVHFVGAQVEQGSLIALGLLNLGSGADQLSDKLRRHLVKRVPPELAAEGTNDEHNEAYKYSLGLSLGLINCGTGRINHADSLISFIVSCSDQSVSSSESVNGIISAFILAFTGTKNSAIAMNLQFPEKKMALKYSLPTTYFGRALAHDLIIWYSITKLEEIIESLRSQLKRLLILPMNGSQDILCEYYWVAGRLVALSMRFVSSNNDSIISLLCESISLLLIEYKRLLKNMFESEAHDKSHPSEKHIHFNYGLINQTRAFADIISHLTLAVSSVAAGFGNLAIMRLLREMWQVNPQFLCNSLGPKSVKYSRVEGCGLDPTIIAQSIGWLFMGNGQVTFKSDYKSVSLLSVFSFQKLLAGPNVRHDHWQHLRFFWSTLTENRCLFAAHDPADPVKIRVNLKENDGRGSSSLAKMPILLPPFNNIASVEIIDSRFITSIITDICEPKIADGVNLEKVTTNPQSLLAKLMELDEENTSNEAQSSYWQHEDVNNIRIVLEHLTKSPVHQTDLLLVLAFFRVFPSSPNCIFSAQWLEQLRLKTWLSSNLNDQ